jgi:hypothetical protein
VAFDVIVAACRRASHSVALDVIVAACRGLTHPVAFDVVIADSVDRVAIQLVLAHLV